MWPLLWNMFGAAFILSLYLYFHTRIINTSSMSNPALPIARARALSPTMALAAYPPALIMLFASRFSDISTSQVIIAIFQFSPLIVAATMYSISALYPGGSSTKNTNDESSYVHLSYAISGLVSAGAHLFTMVITLLSNNRITRFGRVFVPSPSRVISGSIDNVHDGALLFLQYDWIVINLSCALWAYSLIISHRAFSHWQAKVKMALAILLFTLTIGPSATVCIALWVRENKLRKKYVNAQVASVRFAKAHGR